MFDPNQPFTLLAPDEKKRGGFDPSAPFSIVDQDEEETADITEREEPPEIDDRASGSGQFFKTVPLGAAQAATGMARGLATEGHLALSELEDRSGMGYGAGARGKAAYVADQAQLSRLQEQDPERFRHLTVEQLRAGRLPENKRDAQGWGTVEPVDAQAAQLARETERRHEQGRIDHARERWAEGLAKDFGGLTKRLDKGVQEALGVEDAFLESFAGQLAHGAGGLPVYILAALSGVGGNMALQGALFDEAWQDYEQTVAPEDFDPKQGFKIAGTYALAGTALERAGINAILGRTFGKAREMTAGKAVKALVAAAAAEGGTEAAQGLLQDAIAAGAFDDEREVFTRESMDKRLREFTIGAILGAGGSAVSSGVERAGQPPRAASVEFAETPAQEKERFARQAAEFEAASQEEIELFGEPEAPMPRPRATVASEPTAEEQVVAEPPREAGTPEVVETPAEVKPEPKIGDMEDIRRHQRREQKEAARLKQLEGAHEVKAKGARFKVGTRADGAADLLNFVEDNGGIMTPKALRRQGREVMGEYDGFDDAFGTGPMKLLRRSGGGGLHIDDMAAVVMNDFDASIQTGDELRQALEKASEQRLAVAEGMKRMEQQAKFEAFAYAGERTRGIRRAEEQPMSIDQLGVGDSFTIGGQRVVVEEINPDDFSVKLNGGSRFGYQRAQAGQMVWLDRDSLQTAPRAEAAEGDPFREATDRLAGQTKEQGEARRQWLNQAAAKWTEHAEKLAPGVMKSYRIEVGSVLDLGKKTTIGPNRNLANIEAAHFASERMIFLVDSMLRRPNDSMTLLTLQHELGHAHWNTLADAKKTQLERLWKQETESRAGPLYRKDGAMKRGVARGVESDIREWYAERIAWNNHRFAQRRTGVGPKGVEEGAIGRAAQNLRIWLRKALDFLKEKFGLLEDIDATYRRFLDVGAKWVDEAATSPAPAEPVEAASFSERELATADQGKTDLEKRTRFRTIRNRLKESPVGRLSKEYLTSAGNMPQAAFLQLRARNHRLNAALRVVDYTLKDFNKVVRDKLGGWKNVGLNEERAINDHLAGRADWEAAPPELRAALDKMRAQIDGLSRRLINEGVVGETLQGVIEQNVGFYLNRSYRKYDDKKWSQKIMTAKPGTELAKIRTDATRLIHSELRTDLLKELADAQWRQEHPDAKRINRQSQAYKEIHAALDANSDIQPERQHVQNKLQVLLRPDVTPEAFLSGSNPNKKQLGIFKQRKSIPPEIRALWGEHTDARINYARSVIKTMQVLETQRALREIREAGMGAFLWARDYEVPGGGVAIAAEGNEAMSPLDGLYTTPEIKEALTGIDEMNNPNVALAAWYRANGIAKLAKTVLSPVTQARNILANAGWIVANSHYLFWKARLPFKVFMADFFGRGRSSEQLRQYTLRLTRLGVVGESVHQRELQEAMNMAAKANPEGEMTLGRFSESLMVKAAKLPFRKAIEAYRLGDEVVKIYAFENERAKYRWARPEMSEQELDAIAAARVRDTMPNYSMIPKAVEKIRRAGLTGSFVSFASESMRVAYKTSELAVRETFAEKNPRVRAIGAARLVGLAAVGALPAMIQGISQALNGVDDEEDRKLRAYLPDYIKNSNIIYRDKDGQGGYQMIDMSYYDVFNWMRKMANAFLYNDGKAAVYEMAREAYAPVFGEGIVTKSLLDLARNKTDRGGDVYNEAGTELDIALEVGDHLLKTFEPGAVTQGRRIAKAAAGHIEPWGQTYDLTDELVAPVLGFRPMNWDVATALEKKAGAYMGMVRSAARMYNEVSNTKAPVSTEEAFAALEKANDAKYRHWQEMRELYMNALSLNVPSIVIDNALAEGGMGKAEIIWMKEGSFRPYMPSQMNNMPTGL